MSAVRLLPCWTPCISYLSRKHLHKHSGPIACTLNPCLLLILTRAATAAEIFQCRRFVTYFRCVFTPGRQCQLICIIYHHLHRSLAVTKYLDCGGLSPEGNGDGAPSFAVVFVWLLTSKILLRHLNLLALWESYTSSGRLGYLDVTFSGSKLVENE